MDLRNSKGATRVCKWAAGTVALPTFASMWEYSNMVAVNIVLGKYLIICEDMTSLLEEEAEYSLHPQRDFMCNPSKCQQAFMDA